MRHAIRAIPIVCLLLACSPRSNSESQNRRVAELQSQLDAARLENTQLKAQLSRKPDLPVKISFRRALTGPGYVAMFSTTVKAPVPVLATVKSTALGTSKKFELHLQSDSTTELGHLEGAVIEDGDTITLENTNYSSVSKLVSMR
jgi:hypothetical protein